MSDFYNLDSALSEEERAVRDTIRSFVDERVLPIIGDCYIEGRFPKHLIPEMAFIPSTTRFRRCSNTFTMRATACSDSGALRASMAAGDRSP